jgi:hypothetical protein
MPINWTTVLTALIAAAVPALFSGLFSFLNGKKLDTLHEIVNGKMTQALDGALEGQRALGRLEGIAIERDRAQTQIQPEKENVKSTPRI